MYDYNGWQWLLIFYVYCFLGWIFECIVVSVQQKHFVNRGFLKGPMLPIYGFGATIILHVAIPLMQYPAALYFAGLITATAFEYAVGVLMEALFKVKYWDYSEHRFQFQGRICLDSSIAWGFLSLALAYVLHKPVAGFITDLGSKMTAGLVLVVSFWFVYDTVTSAKAAFEFASVLEELEKLRSEAEELRVQLQLGVYEAQERLEGLRERVENAQSELREQVESVVENAQEELRERVETAKKALQERTADRRIENAGREQLRNRLAEIEDAMAERMRRRNRQYRALLRANPSAKSVRFGEMFRLWRDRDQ